MELRDIEILLVLAEELHFGRTAALLHISQGRVSQVVKAQERKIGTTLFERNNRRVALTPIGEQLIKDLRTVQQGLNESLARAMLAAQGKTDVLRIGTPAWNYTELKPIFDTFAKRSPGTEIQIRTISFAAPFDELRAGQIDMAILWLPVREPDLTAGPVVFTESTVLAASVDHPLADQESISLEDLADHAVVDGVTPAYWREALVPSRTPSGKLIPIGPTVTSIEQMLPILSSGTAVSPLHGHAVRYLQRPDIALIPIQDAPLAQWALVWHNAAEIQTGRAFAELVEEHGPLNL